MTIDSSTLPLGIWYTDEQGKVVSRDPSLVKPEGAVFANVCFPLEVRTEMYRLREDGNFGNKDKVLTSVTSLSKMSGKLAVAMVNSGDYDLEEALVILATACERCCNVLWDKYLPDEHEGYAEYSEEWKKANTYCQFCEDMGYTNHGDIEP